MGKSTKENIKSNVPKERRIARLVAEIIRLQAQIDRTYKNLEAVKNEKE